MFKFVCIYVLLLKLNHFECCCYFLVYANFQFCFLFRLHPIDTPLPYDPATPSIYYHVHRSGAYSSVNPASLPGTPKNLRAPIVETRFVTLTWGEPDRKGQSKIVGYSIRWQERGSER